MLLARAGLSNLRAFLEAGAVWPRPRSSACSEPGATGCSTVSDTGPVFEATIPA